MKQEYFALCITRTCGSGGTEIGKMLAQQLGIDLYDRKLLRLASEDSGINEKIFAKADQDTKKTLLYKVSKSVYNGELIPPESGNFLSDRNLFEYQAKVLKELLKKESYVVLGRAADFVLRDKPNAISIFLSASEEACFAREMEIMQTDSYYTVTQPVTVASGKSGLLLANVKTDGKIRKIMTFACARMYLATRAAWI